MRGPQNTCKTLVGWIFKRSMSVYVPLLLMCFCLQLDLVERNSVVVVDQGVLTYYACAMYIVDDIVDGPYGDR